jgi:hypothetical protein
MAHQQRNPSIVFQLVSNRELLTIHARSQIRLDQLRAEAAVRSIAANDSVLAAGAMRNMVLGAVLPAARAAAESRRQRRSRR